MRLTTQSGGPNLGELPAGRLMNYLGSERGKRELAKIANEVVVKDDRIVLVIEGEEWPVYRAVRATSPEVTDLKPEFKRDDQWVVRMGDNHLSYFGDDQKTYEEIKTFLAKAFILNRIHTAAVT